MSKLSAFILAAVVALAGLAGPAAGQTTLRVVMHSDLKIVDPIWTTAYISRNHGYMIYDTLFAMDAKGEIQPQMVDRYEVSPDQLTYTLTLRNGLLWHDGTPVTSEDCIASIKRWGAKDSMGQKMMAFVRDFAVVNPQTFQLQGLQVLLSLRQPLETTNWRLSLSRPLLSVPRPSRSRPS